MEKFLPAPQSSYYHVAIAPGTRGLVRVNLIAAQEDARAFGLKARVQKLLPHEATPYLEADRRLLNATA